MPPYNNITVASSNVSFGFPCAVNHRLLTLPALVDMPHGWWTGPRSERFARRATTAQFLLTPFSRPPLPHSCTLPLSDAVPATAWFFYFALPPLHFLRTPIPCHSPTPHPVGGPIAALCLGFCLPATACLHAHLLHLPPLHLLHLHCCLLSCICLGGKFLP